MQQDSALTKRTSTQQPEKADDTPAGIDDWLTRGEVAEVMRVSVTTVRRLQGRDLHPRRSPEGFYLFDPEEVEAVRARRPPPPETNERRDDPGELAADAFRLLREGVDVRDLVIALRRPPKEIEALYTDWERLGDMLVVSPRVRSQLERMVRHRLLSLEIWEAIEDNDADTLCDLVSDAVAARSQRR